MRYIITWNNKISDSLEILAYNDGNRLNNGSKGDGYFWTDMKNFAYCLDHAPADCPMLFNSKAEARKFAKEIELSRGYKITKFPFRIN